MDGDRFRVEAIDAKAGFKVKDEVKRNATLDPSNIQIGRFQLRLSHQRYPAIIVFDPQSPRMKEYKGMEYFPVDLSYRYELPLTRIPKPEKIIIVSTRGNRRSAERVGWFDFLVGNNAVQARSDSSARTRFGRRRSVRLLPRCYEREGNIPARTLCGCEKTPERELPAGFQHGLQSRLRIFELLQLPGAAEGEHADRRNPRRRKRFALSLGVGSQNSGDRRQDLLKGNPGHVCHQAFFSLQ